MLGDPDAAVQPGITDRTAAGTKVLGMGPGGDASLAFEYVQLGDWVYFAGTTPGEGIELWRTKGTTATTKLFVDIRWGAAPGRCQRR